MIRFINIFGKENRFSFIRAKCDKSFGCPFMYCSEIRIKESRWDDWGSHYNIDLCRQQRVVLKSKYVVQYR